MNNIDELLTALRLLEAWFERRKRVLPWRSEPTPYRVWVSEIMLQQTQVATVIPYFEKFIERFPTVESLANAPEEEVLLHWAGLGYYTRARNIHKAARRIVENGRFPMNREEWEATPGVGPYTAGAILSISQDHPEAILDGNVERVLSRLRKISRDQGDTEYKKRLWALAKEAVEIAHDGGIRPSITNQALMELGATVCTPSRPRCTQCPFSDARTCQASLAHETELYPPKKAPKQWLRVDEELHCVLDHQGRLLLRRRDEGEWRAGMWDLPGAGILNLFKLVKVGRVETRHVVTRHKIFRVTHVWRVDLEEISWKASEPLAADTPHGSSLRWIYVENPDVALSSSLKRTVKHVFERFPLDGSDENPAVLAANSPGLSREKVSPKRRFTAPDEFPANQGSQVDNCGTRFPRIR